MIHTRGQVSHKKHVILPLKAVQLLSNDYLLFHDRLFPDLPTCNEELPRSLLETTEFINITRNITQSEGQTRCTIHTMRYTDSVSKVTLTFIIFSV